MAIYYQKRRRKGASSLEEPKEAASEHEPGKLVEEELRRRLHLLIDEVDYLRERVQTLESYVHDARS